VIILAENTSGNVVFKTPCQTLNGTRWWPTAAQAIEAWGGNPSKVLVYEISDDAEAKILADQAPENLEATINGGVITAVSVKANPPELWLHGFIDTGTVNQLTGTRYIERGQVLIYSASLRESSDLASAIVTHIPGSDPPVAVSGEWALELVHELGLDQFSPMVTLTEGQTSGSVTIPDRLCDGLYQLPEERMAMVGPFKLRLAQPKDFEFKVRS
jgi:hypothetical protein